MVSLTQKHVRGRLVESLLMLGRIYGFEADGKTINASLSRNDIAHLSNMTTSNAIRTLSNLASEGNIKIKGRKITILNFATLKGSVNRPECNLFQYSDLLPEKYSFNPHRDGGEYLIRNSPAFQCNLINCNIVAENFSFIACLSIQPGNIRHAHIHTDISDNGNSCLPDKKVSVPVSESSCLIRQHIRPAR